MAAVIVVTRVVFVAGRGPMTTPPVDPNTGYGIVELLWKAADILSICFVHTFKIIRLVHRNGPPVGYLNGGNTIISYFDITIPVIPFPQLLAIPLIITAAVDGYRIGAAGTINAYARYGVVELLGQTTNIAVIGFIGAL